MSTKPLILITNDDSLHARGIQALIESLRTLGDIVVVAPDSPRSAQSSALTVTLPVRVGKTHEEDGVTVYRCNGTPADCVKIALKRILPRKPDLLVSGINHGTNASISVIYSGTVGATLEGCIGGIPSIGMSLCDYSPHADFGDAAKYARIIAKNVLQNALPKNVCLNVNVPAGVEIKGVKICTQADGIWVEDFIHREDPLGKSYYWLTGHFKNLEPENTATDEWALANGYVSIVPVKINMTATEYIEALKTWNYELE